MIDFSAMVPRCNFCGSSMNDLPDDGKMVQAEKIDAWICETCIRLCYGLLQEDESRKSN
jgi:ClpX C4-type zinc finger